MVPQVTTASDMVPRAIDPLGFKDLSLQRRI